MEGSLALKSACPKLGEALPAPLHFQNCCIPVSESVHRQLSKRVIVLEPRGRSSQTLQLVDTLVGRKPWKRGRWVLRPRGSLADVDLKARPLQLLHSNDGRSCSVLTGDSNNNIVQVLDNPGRGQRSQTSVNVTEGVRNPDGKQRWR